MNKVHFLRTLVFGALLLAANLIHAADIQVGVDRNPVGFNESFQITFTASEQPDGNPDFSPLQGNFEVLDQQRSSSTSLVNGRVSRSEQWIVRAMAKQTGELLIPPIAFGNDLSKPLKIVVSENQNQPQSNDEVFMEVEATPEKPYVQSQVLYTLRLYRRVQITQATLSEPEIKDALIEKLGDENTYSTQVKGVDYWVTERKYAIFPQQSGVFTIAPLVLNAEVLVQSQRPQFNGFFNRQATETRRISSKAITLNVQAVPASFNNAAWLSAESLQLAEKWSDNGLQIKVGEPLTRTLTVLAKGTTVGQLPELSGQLALDGIKTYPDQPVLKEDKQSDGLTAFREEKVAFIPSKPGDYTLPALEISWFNIKTQQVEVARLPSVTIKALAAAGDVVQQPQAQSPLQPEHVATASEGQAVVNGELRFWQALSALLAVGWLLTGIRMFRHASRESVDDANFGETLPDTAAEKALKRACQENDPQAAKQALLQWGRRQFGADSLGAIAVFCPQALADEINSLNRQLYAQGQQSWRGLAFWQAFSQRAVEKKATSEVDDGLEPLYRL